MAQKQKLHSLLIANERGVGLIEYNALALFILLVLVGAVALIGQDTQEGLGDSSCALNHANLQADHVATPDHCRANHCEYYPNHPDLKC